MTYRYSLPALSVLFAALVLSTSCRPRAEAEPKLVSANPAQAKPATDTVEKEKELDELEKEMRFLKLVRGTRIELPPAGAAIYASETDVVVSILYDHPVREVRTGGKKMKLEGGKYRGHVDGLKSGEQVVSVEVVDEKGVVASASTHVTIDTEAPRVEITEPKEGAEVASPVEIKGSASDDSRVKIELERQHVPIDSLGHFQHKLVLPPGKHVIQVLAKDPGGRSTMVRRTITVR